MAASIAVGIRNWIVTTSIRTGTIQLEEFRSQIRDPIQAQMNKLGEIRESLAALQRPNALSDDDLKSKISDLVASFEFTLQDLGDLLDHADKSSFAEGTNWRSRYIPRLETAVERLGNLTASSALDRIAAGATMNDVVRTIVEIAGELRLRFEHGVKDLVPAGLLGLQPKRKKR